MHSRIAKPGLESDFRSKSTLLVALVVAAILTPLSIDNFSQGRTLVAAGELAIVLLLAFSAWRIKRGRYCPLLIQLGLVPVMLFTLTVALNQHVFIGILWSYPVVLSFYLMLPERKAWIANAFLLGMALPISWYLLNPLLTVRVVASLLAVSAFSAVFVRVIANQQKQLETLAITDSLTGVLNRRLLHSTLDLAIRQHQRSETPMALIALDLDHFKSINDSLGHDAGDSVLAGVGDLLGKRVRSSDRVFRLGGEEFLVFLYGTGLDGALSLAEALRAEIGAGNFLADRKVTASLGVAELRTGEEWSAWMKRCDENMYRAKAEGRNRAAA